MNAVKKLLRHMIERMSDAEARQLLEFAQHLRHRRDDSLTWKRLAADPAFKVPVCLSGKASHVRVFHPCGESCSVCFRGVAVSHDVSLLPLPVLREKGFAVLSHSNGTGHSPAGKPLGQHEECPGHRARFAGALL
jgi:hypothetical protein